MTSNNRLTKDKWSQLLMGKITRNLTTGGDLAPKPRTVVVRIFLPRYLWGKKMLREIDKDRKALFSYCSNLVFFFWISID